jgi:hypothetical protein
MCEDEGEPNGEEGIGLEVERVKDVGHQEVQVRVASTMRVPPMSRRMATQGTSAMAIRVW